MLLIHILFTISIMQQISKTFKTNKEMLDLIFLTKISQKWPNLLKWTLYNNFKINMKININKIIINKILIMQNINKIIINTKILRIVIILNNLKITMGNNMNNQIMLNMINQIMLNMINLTMVNMSNLTMINIINLIMVNNNLNKTMINQLIINMRSLQV